MERNINENKSKKKISSICRFDFIENVKSKNIPQNDDEKSFRIVSINVFKTKKIIILLFYLKIMQL